MQVPMWLVVVVGVVAVVGFGSVLKWIAGVVSRRHLIEQFTPMVMEISGVSRREAQAQLRALLKEPSASQAQVL